MNNEKYFGTDTTANESFIQHDTVGIKEYRLNYLNVLIEQSLTIKNY
jgi:hypothetical protein